MADDDDPGWPRFAFTPLVPFVSWRRHDRGVDGLVALRRMFVAFCVAIPMFGVVVAWSDVGASKRPAGAVVLLVVGVGIVLAGTVVERPLTCADAAALRASYLNRFFVRIAFAESPALVGFGGVFVTGERWLYPLAALITYVGFARAAPTREHLLRDQERLRTHGCSVSLTTSLRASPPQ